MVDEMLPVVTTYILYVPFLLRTFFPWNNVGILWASHFWPINITLTFDHVRHKCSFPRIFDHISLITPIIAQNIYCSHRMLSIVAFMINKISSTILPFYCYSHSHRSLKFGLMLDMFSLLAIRLIFSELAASKRLILDMFV